MPSIWDGTYLFIWQADQIYGGDVNAMIAKAKELGIIGGIGKRQPMHN